jgi:anti-anti-sigma regulatory factor
VTQMLSRIPTPRGAVLHPEVAAQRPADDAVGQPRAYAPAPDDVLLETRQARLLVRFTGEVDTALRPRFDRVLAVVRAAREPVLVDCREVTFFCAEGVRMLVLLQRAAGGPGVAEFQSSRSVDRALRLSGIDRYPFLD